MRAAHNAVPVDEAAAIAELEAIGAGAELEQAVEFEEAAELERAAAGHDPAAWLKASEFAVTVFAGQVVPNWDLAVDDCTKLSASLAEVLDHYFPGGPSGPTHPAWALAFAVGTVTLTRGVDWETGKLKPGRKPQPKEGSESGADDGEAEGRIAAVPDGQEPIGQEPKRFTMGGG